MYNFWISNFIYRYIMIYFMIGLLFSILAAGAVDGDASLTTLSICAFAGIVFMSLGVYKMHKDEQDF